MKGNAKEKIVWQGIQSAILPSLPVFEICIYFLVWIYSLYVVLEKVYFVALEYKSFYSSENFAEGWNLLNREKDISEYEWAVWSDKYISFIPWIFTHVAISQFLWLKKAQFIPYFYITLSLTSTIFFLGVLPTFYLLLQSLIMFPTHLLKSRIFCWVVAIGAFVCININPISKILEFIVPSYSVEEYMLSVVSAWLNIRCLSFCLHRCSIDSRRSKTIKNDLSCYLAFCFYFPLLFTGPLMMFSDFEKQLFAPKPKWNRLKIFLRVANVLRYVFWFMFNEIVLHFFYAHVFRLHLNLVSHCPRLALAGVGYGVSQFFMTKYTVLYGLPRAIAQFEHFDPPEKPKCVARIHLYSDMWRYFDRGLYTFFTRYIYIPMLGDSRNLLKKIFAAMMCFLFVFVWHGTSYAIFVWAFLNFIEVILEMIFNRIGSNESIVLFEEKWISHNWSRRLRAMFAVPLLYLGCISNFYFLVGYDVTNIMLDRLLFNAPISFVTIQTFCLYCSCQVSIEIKNWELRRLKCKRLS